MKRNNNLTLKRLVRRHQENPQDGELHKIIEAGSTSDKKFNGLVEEATKNEPFDKKK